MSVKNQTIVVYRIPQGGTKEDAFILLKVTVPLYPYNIQDWVRDLGGDYYEVEDNNYSSGSAG